MKKLHRLRSELRHVETIATGPGVRALPYLREVYGPGKWRKMKGVAEVELTTGEVVTAEVHWYEAHGIGRVDWKIKRELE
ncbi:hypothetical protein ACERK3_09150 [Phycisphaerales bacterium AB-hyl4]|uniref:Uncharacterized protein n=1 Tax=Natronomicrosphaera hydrolytica TaxID=3242702 RepID=A0ABV4U4D1_9BACT